MKIIFDMDGTIADLYGVEDWLKMLRDFDETPYEIAKPLLNMSRLARALHKAQAVGMKVTVVSWLSAKSCEEYDKCVALAKAEWLAAHLPSVRFDEINLVPYGIDKSTFADESDILFDDNEEIRNSFIGKAYSPDKIFEILKGLVE